MISVYKMVFDFNKSKYIMTDELAALSGHIFDGRELADDWKPPPTYVANPRKKTPDICGVYGCSGFAVNQQVAEQLVTFLDQSCECLRFDVEDLGPMLFCNVTCVVDALDKKASVYDEDIPHMIDQYAFKKSRFEYSLFKLPQNATVEVLCVEGLVDPSDEFKGTVERLGLKGIEFRKIWEG